MTDSKMNHLRSSNEPKISEEERGQRSQNRFSVIVRKTSLLLIAGKCTIFETFSCLYRHILLNRH